MATPARMLIFQHILLLMFYGPPGIPTTQLLSGGNFPDERSKVIRHRQTVVEHRDRVSTAQRSRTLERCDRLGPAVGIDEVEYAAAENKVVAIARGEISNVINP